MSGDYTRFTFKPANDYSSVFKQQGRVDLDADWNELVEMVDRRWRSETIDIIGHCVVPDATPDAFDITPTAMGQFNIGTGRIYVDGIQVECHGRPPDQYQADLGEMRGMQQVPYSDQPYLPASLPPPLAATPNTTDCVYLEVWEREVTSVEQPALQEVALGGPDTATRMQTVWQVRVQQNVNQRQCSDQVDLGTSSAGRLTTSTTAPPAADDPCIIAPSGGYRGLENHLYRVEIHAPGTIGGLAPARFKWSRDDASVAAIVDAIPSPTSITVRQLGRDRVLRFNIGDWIEISDDFREFQGRAGHMAQITDINDATRTITFAQAIPAGTFDNANPLARHSRVRRWDQTLNVDANGLLDVTAGPIEIEAGVRVEFTLDPPGGSFHVGDYWVLAARTADGSVELLQNAPPRGILHHFCKLGFINWGANIGATTFTDCRVHWPPPCTCDGSCTVTVGDGVDSHGQFTEIQQAVNALGDRGGIVCIGRGVYVVGAPVVLDNTKRNVIIRGMGPATRIIFVPAAEAGGQAFLVLNDTENVRLEDVFVAAMGSEAVVRLHNSNSCRIENCTLVNVPRENAQLTMGVLFTGDLCANCEIVHNNILAAKGVAAVEARMRELLLRENHLLTVQAGLSMRNVDGLEVLHNRFRGFRVEGIPGDIVLNRDSIDAFQSLISLALRDPAAFATFQAVGLLVYTGRRVVISENLIAAQVGVLGFLYFNSRIERNDILSLIGVLLIFGVNIHVDDNLLLSLFAGLVHAGIIVALDCTNNEFLGFNGILMSSLAELVAAFGSLLGGALSALGFGAGPALVTSAVTMGVSTAGAFERVGLALIVKAHRNVFLTFTFGILKTDLVISGDISVVDNSFSLCSQAAVRLGRNISVLRGLDGFVSPRHLLKANALTVRGAGFQSVAPLTQVEENTCRSIRPAVELAAPLSTVRQNWIAPLEDQLTHSSGGQVVLHRGASSIAISGNQLLGSPGHAILVQDAIAELAIDDNFIRGARLKAIGASSDTVAVDSLRIARNHIENCRGEPVPGSLEFTGAVVIGAGSNVRVLDNQVVNNSPLAGGPPLSWFAIYLEDVQNVEIAGNLVVENGTVAGLTGLFGAMGLQSVRGAIRVQGNIVQGNGGVALLFAERAAAPGQVQHMLVQDNHFSTGLPGPAWVFIVGAESLLFQNNQSINAATGLINGLVLISATLCNVSSNNVETRAPFGMAVGGTKVNVNGNTVQAGEREALFVSAGAMAIVTSNLTTGLLAFSGGPLVRANNIPAP